MEQIWDLIINNFIGCLLVFSRVTGIFTFNPIFGRQNVPMRVRVSLSLVLAVSMLTFMGGTTGYVPDGVIGFVFVILLEALIGLVFGFITNLILTVLIYAGELIDNQIGLSMAKAMDPSTGIQMPVFGNLYYYLFIFYFFLTDGHFQYIKLFAISYEIIPIGYEFTEVTLSLTRSVAMYFGEIMVLAVKLAIPIVATELIVEFCVGVIMKAVPTIQIFSVNIQLKIIIGLLVMLAIAVPVSEFMDRLLEILSNNLSSVLTAFA